MFQSPRRKISAGWHALVGTFWFRLQRLDRSRLHFERAILLRSADAKGYERLGRVAFAAGDYVTWRRCMDRLRDAAPERMARARRLFRFVGPRAAGTLADTAGQPGARAARVRRPRPDEPEPIDPGLIDPGAIEPGLVDPGLIDPGAVEPGSVEPVAEPGLELPGWPDPEALAGEPATEPFELADAGLPGEFDPEGYAADDFASEEERARFRALAAIRWRDIDDCDIDDLARRLFR